MDEHTLASIAAALAPEASADPDLRAGLALLAARSRLASAPEEAVALLLTAADLATLPARRQEVAEALLAATRAVAKRDAEMAERALRRAADLAPALGLPALAQAFQRAGRSDEALAAWQEVSRLAPADSPAALQSGRLHEQAGCYDDALTAYLRLIDAAPTGRNYLQVAQRLEALTAKLPPAPANRVLRIALEGSATLDHLRSYLIVECYRAGLRPTFYQGGFDQYTQDILNPASALYAFAPEVLILAVHASRLFPHLHDYPFALAAMERRAELEAGLATVERLLTTFRERSAALVLLNNMVAPQHPALGLLDWRDELGQAALFAEINGRLAVLLRERFQNAYIVDEDRVQARVGKAQATDPRLWFAARMGWSDALLPALAAEYVRYLKPYRGLGRKCVVLDLDNTLWGGVVGEDGLEGIALGAEAPGNAFVAFQRELEKLWRRGILLAVCSKNNPDDALAVFERHPDMVLRRSHFAAERINWESKADNLRAIAQELNIGLDSLVFLDDNPVERARVRAELPQVLVPELPTDPAGYRAALLALDAFESLALTEEDRQRNRLYAEQRERKALEERFASSASGDALDAYLANLQITVAIAPVDALTLPRISQLTSKTNQFNLTTRRYGEAQIEAMRVKGWGVYGMRVGDRFGDNGLTGVAILAPASDGAAEIDTLLLSCRVMGRGVETALLAFLADEARRRGLYLLRGWYLPTEKNAPAKDVYARHGFRAAEERPDGAVRWELDLRVATITPPAWLTVRAPVLAA